ncbi:MAG: hypothetical protein RL885_19860 [Planctomycetota bacterium]
MKAFRPVALLLAIVTGGFTLAALTVNAEAARELLPAWRSVRDTPLVAWIVSLGIAATVLLPRARARVWRGAAILTERRRGAARHLWIPVALIFFAAMVGLRSQRYDLGDASVLIEDVPYDVHVYGQNVWPDEVLARLSRSLFYRIAHQLLGVDVVLAFAISSALWGLAYAWVLIGIGRTLFPNRPRARSVPLLLGLSIGNVQLFFGYIEVYSGVTVCLLLYAWQSYRYLAGFTSIVLPALALALGIGFYAPAGAALPSLLLLCFCSSGGALKRPGRNIGLAMVTGLSVIGAVAALYFVVFRYPLDHVARSHGFGRWTFLVERDDPDFWYRTFDWAHIRDFVLLTLRFGGAVLFLWIASWIARPALGSSARGRFELTLTAGLGLFCFLVHPDLGVERDWDLLSFGNLGVLLLAARWLPEVVARDDAVERTASGFVAVGMLMTSAFVLTNTMHEGGDPHLLADKDRPWIREWGIGNHRARTMHEFAHLAAAERHVLLAMEAIAASRDDVDVDDLQSSAVRLRLLTLYRNEALPSDAEEELARADADYREAVRENPANLRTLYRWLDVMRILKRPREELRSVLDRLLRVETDPVKRSELEALGR